MTFPCVFRFLTKKASTFDNFSLCFQVSDKKHKEESLKVDVFSVSFGLNFEDEGAIRPAFFGKCFGTFLGTILFPIFRLFLWTFYSIFFNICQICSLFKATSASFMIDEVYCKEFKDINLLNYQTKMLTIPLIFYDFLSRAKYFLEL